MTLPFQVEEPAARTRIAGSSVVFIITHFTNVVIEAAEISFNVQIFTFNDCVHDEQLGKMSK